MARKLKSDRVLFIATILLVGLSVVMVYSASAVIALERYQQPYLFLTKQALWSALGLAVLLAPAAASLDMFRDYAHRGEAFVEAVLRLIGEDDGGTGAT